MSRPISDTSSTGLRPPMRRRSDCTVEWQLPDDTDEILGPRRRAADAERAVRSAVRRERGTTTEAAADEWEGRTAV